MNMTLTVLQNELQKELKPRITVIGVGGAGGNAVNNMIRGDLKGVKFITSNTDAQALSLSLAEAKIQLGFQATQGLGAGSHPEVGRVSAEESIEDVLSHIDGSNMLFVTAGMGGGTGTGAAPVIAKAARDKGVLTIGVVTKPFHFEGTNRMRTAEKGIEELQQYVDTLIIIPNQNLFRVANEKTTFADAFKMADDVLYSGVRSVTDLMMKPGLINLDFADVRAVMGGMMGKAMMGTGEAQGEGRAIEAAEAAISSPLLDDVSMRGAKAVLINITGGLDMTLYEVDEAANRIREEVDPDAHIIFGSTFDEGLEGRIRVSCVATGIDAHAASLLSKARISELEKEIQASIMKTPEVTSFESSPDLHQEVSAELNFEDREMTFKETDPSLQTLKEKLPEDPYRYATPPSEQEEGRSLSLFERLIGRKNQSVRAAPEALKRPFPQAMVQSTFESVSEDEDESIEIPAFLRRQSGR
jgi:cell division protein FtsZ